MLTLADRLRLVGQKGLQFVGYKLWTTNNGPNSWALTGWGSLSSGGVGLGGGIKAGDIAFLYVARGDTGGHSISPPAGWSELQTGQGSDTRVVSADLYYIEAASAFTSQTVTFGTNDTLASQAAGALVFRNYDTATPVKQSVDATGINTVRANPPALTSNALATYLYFGSGAINSGFGGTYSSSDIENFWATTAVDDTDTELGVGWSATTINPAAFSTSGDSGGAAWHAASARIHTI